MHCVSFIFYVMHGHFFSFREIQILMLNFSLSNHTQLYTILNNQIYIISNNTIHVLSFETRSTVCGTLQKSGESSFP